jgi:hypothetical protein
MPFQCTPIVKIVMFTCEQARDDASGTRLAFPGARARLTLKPSRSSRAVAHAKLRTPDVTYSPLSRAASRVCTREQTP